MACQNIPRNPVENDTSGPAVSGTAVLAVTHSKLESIFPSLDLSGGGGGATAVGRTGNGRAEE